MKFSGITMRVDGIVGACAAALLGGLAVATVAAPSAAAAPRAVQRERAVGHRQLGDGFGPRVPRQPPRRQPGGHRGAEPAATAGAEANLRGYFTANPSEYYDLRGILAPIGDTQRQCNVTVLPASWRRPTASSWPAEIEQRIDPPPQPRCGGGFSYSPPRRLD